MVALDQRGHGASSWTADYSPELMAGDIAAVVDALDLRRLNLVGHSMGGVNSWCYAGRRPDRVERLVILDIDPVAIVSPQLVRSMKDMLDSYAGGRFAEAEDAVADYLSAYTGPAREASRRFVLENLRQEAGGAWTWRFDSLGLRRWVETAAADEAAHWRALRRLTCPTLILRALDSFVTTTNGTDRMVREMVDARLVVVPDAGHDVHLDQPGVVTDELRRFLLADGPRPTA